MLLRPRQKEFVERSLAALKAHGNALGVAPTGAGKTILFSEIIGRHIKSTNARTLVLAHRDELTSQNQDKFKRINPSLQTSVYDSRSKSWDGQVTFGMVQTLSLPANLKTIPPIDFLVIDEAHHSVATTYKIIIDRALALNPNCLVLGLTATPNRSDGKGLREVFSNVCDQISLGELIRSGHLVVPRTFVIDVGVKAQLSNVKELGADFDMVAVDQIMNQRPINSAVVDQWQEKGENRQTVVFCSTVKHAEAITDAFKEAGIKAAAVTGQLTNSEREKILDEYASGHLQIIINVQVLTEGWDHPPTSCVVLLRPCSAKSTMMQMVGRGLRIVNSNEHPGIIKSDCIILDFGTSSLLHGTLEQDISLDGIETDGVALSMSCPECEAKIPLSSVECPICGHSLRSDKKSSTPELVSSVEMMEINLLSRSSFEWVNLFEDHSAFISTGFNAWGGVFFHDGNWFALGGRKNSQPRILSIGQHITGLAAADDWLNENETEETAHKTSGWLSQEPTEKQISILANEHKLDFNLTRYKASAHITFQVNKEKIRDLIKLQ
jgi:DNA repair protein RadD